MKTKALRLYGKDDIRLEEFDLPPIGEDEILARVVTDSLCLSSYKATMQGAEHKRVPADIAQNPVILGHEFCGEIVEVGAKHAGKFKPGQKFAIQPALNYKGGLEAPGYSFCYIGGDATYIIIPSVVMEQDCLFVYEGDAFFMGSLSEPVSCVAGAFHANYHTHPGKYLHHMGIKPGGKMCIMAGCGPMGMCAVQYALACDIRPSLLVVTDIASDRIARAEKYLSPQQAAEKGVTLIYKNTAGTDEKTLLRELSGGTGFDDVFVMAPIAPLIELGDAILAFDGCLNFFAGPSEKDFTAKFNFYNVHYASSHLAAASGGNNDDLAEVLHLLANGSINPAFMITHIGGLDAAAETTRNLPKIPGGKKLIYTNISLPLTAIADFAEQGRSNPLLAELAKLCPQGVWTPEAERYLIANGKAI